jgi:quercetin dioxygenase-like cupin family protein
MSGLSQLEETNMTETLDVGGIPMTVKRDVGIFLAEHPVPSGHFVPPHRHAHDEEMFYVIEGELTLIGETGESKAGAGSFRSFAPGVVHGYRNDTPETVKLLVIAQPGVQLAEMFRHFDRAAKKAPLERSNMVAIAAEYGVSFD